MNSLTDLSLINEYFELSIYSYARMDHGGKNKYSLDESRRPRKFGPASAQNYQIAKIADSGLGFTGQL